MTPEGLRRTLSLPMLLLWPACGSLLPPASPVEFQGLERPSGVNEPARLSVVLDHYGPTPNELRVTWSPPEGGSSELDCAEFGAQGVRCEGTVRGKGEGHVRVNYRAVDGRLESAAEELLLHGDEEEIALNGSFDEDASLARLASTTYRAADPRVSLQASEEQERLPGDAPVFSLTNGSDVDIVVLAQNSFLLGSTIRMGDDGNGQDVYPDSTGGCGFGLGFHTLSPGMAAHAVGASGLRPGSYFYVIEFDDVETVDDSRVYRRVMVSFEVAGPAPEAENPELSGFGAWMSEPDFWAGAAVPTRPGLERPEGAEGSQRADDAPFLADGADISGVLSPERSRHTYRLRLQPRQQGVVRIFARCTESPCSAQAGIYSGIDDDVRGAERALHRDPPAWSRREDIVHEEDDVLVIGCRETCDAGWEFYGRVHVRTIPKDER